MLADPDARADLPQEALDVLNNFELLAYLVVRSKTLKMEDVWVNFPAAIQWWYVCRPGIEALRKDDPTIYEDYVALVDDMISLEVKRRGRSREALTPSESDMTAFLEGEASLAAPQPSGRKSSWPWGRREE